METLLVSFLMMLAVIIFGGIFLGVVVLLICGIERAVEFMRKKDWIT